MAFRCVFVSSDSTAVPHDRAEVTHAETFAGVQEFLADIAESELGDAVVCLQVYYVSDNSGLFRWS